MTLFENYFVRKMKIDKVIIRRVSLWEYIDLSLRIGYLETNPQDTAAVSQSILGLLTNIENPTIEDVNKYYQKAIDFNVPKTTIKKKILKPYKVPKRFMKPEIPNPTAEITEYVLTAVDRIAAEYKLSPETILLTWNVFMLLAFVEMIERRHAMNNVNQIIIVAEGSRGEMKRVVDLWALRSKGIKEEVN